MRERGLLLATARARGGDEDPVYRYLDRLAADEDRAELGRLLYVGCTRARERLHLTATLDARLGDEGVREWRPPATGSALARLWDALADRIGPPGTAVVPVSRIAESPPLLVRPVRGWTVPLPPPGVPVDRQTESPRSPVPFDWARETARCIGIVVHRMLAQIANDGLAAWSDARLAAAMPRVRAELADEGVDVAEIEIAAAEVRAAVANVLADPRGRWLFAPERSEAASEWALAGVDDGAIVHVVLDRSFVDGGIRWIVDFKTGRHEGTDVDAFLDRETERYRDQLHRYARFVSVLDARPVRLGLYHPLLRGWREWPFPG